MTARRRAFALWQPAYAERKIATFPVRDNKMPAIRGYQKVGLRGSRELAHKFADSGAFGFMCGARSRVTVLDVDTTDEQVLADALGRHGSTPILVRTASGKWHAWYRHNGEPRRIRPWPGLDIDILGARGFVLAPPSRVAHGRYQFAQGSLDDFESLPVMLLDDGTPAPDSASPLCGMRKHDGRNQTLFLAVAPVARDIYAEGGSREMLIDVANKHNNDCEEPMTSAEVTKIVDSVWRMTREGRNWVRQRRLNRRQREVASFSEDTDAFFLLEFLRVNEGAATAFWIANGLADRWAWRRHRLAQARARLLELGYIVQIRRAAWGRPAEYAWPSEAGAAALGCTKSSTLRCTKTSRDSYYYTSPSAPLWSPGCGYGVAQPAAAPADESDRYAKHPREHPQR
jgi:hypothetical protein